MKTAVGVSLLLALALGLSGCSTVSTRINEKSAVFNSLDPNTRAKIAQGDVDLGYTPDMVYIALGAPDATREKISSQGATETWIYRSFDDYGYYPAMGWGGGFYGGGHGFRHGGYGRYGYAGFYGGGWRMHGGRHWRNDDTRITFQNGRVATIDRPGK